MHQHITTAQAPALTCDADFMIRGSLIFVDVAEATQPINTTDNDKHITAVVIGAPQGSASIQAGIQSLCPAVERVYIMRLASADRKPVIGLVML